MPTALDFLSIGAHPDDAEIGTGAFLLKMKKRGYRTGILCLTEGDMGNGTPEQRRKEAAEAAAGLKVDAFEILNLGDTRLEDSFDNRVTVASLIRTYRPTVVLAPYYGLEPGRGRGHADHIAAGYLASHAANFAHLEKFPAQGKAHFIKKLFYYFLAPSLRPTFIVPVDEEFPEAIEAMRAHASQFNRTDRPVFFPTRLESTAAYYGALIGAKYGQAFYVQDPLRLDDPLPLFA